MTAFFDFSGYVAEHTRGFVGREWVFAEIDAWLADPDAPRFFIIIGEPGIGKTAIAARMTQIRDLDAYHFCIGRRADTVDPINFTRSLSLQLARIPDFAEILVKEQGAHVDMQVNVGHNYGRVTGVQIEHLITKSASASIAFNSMVANPLGRLYAGGLDIQVVMLVDAMDRAVQCEGGKGIVDLLSKADGLPRQVRFILTSRPESDVLRHFEQPFASQFELGREQEENLEDLREYVRLRLRKTQSLREQLAEQGIQPQKFIGQLAEASQGNFLHLTSLLRAFLEEMLQVDKLDALPMELGGIYREYLRTWSIGEDIRRWRTYRPLLGVLAAAQAPLTVEQLAEFSEMGMQGTTDFLIDSQQFISQTEDGKYRLFHQSLIDFLSTQESAGEFWIDLTPIHKQIVTSYHAHYHTHWDDIDDYGIRFLLYHVVQYQAHTSTQETAGYGSEYAVRWLFLHLKAAGRADEIGRFVSQVWDR